MLARGITCPRKAIIKSASKNLLHPDDVKVIRNINTPEDLEEARKLLETRV
jgi:GTP:adenosylcobinamide-phosphate guanylyltransferase